MLRQLRDEGRLSVMRRVEVVGKDINEFWREGGGVVKLVVDIVILRLKIQLRLG